MATRMWLRALEVLLWSPIPPPGSLRATNQTFGQKTLHTYWTLAFFVLSTQRILSYHMFPLPLFVYGVRYPVLFVSNETLMAQQRPQEAKLNHLPARRRRALFAICWRSFLLYKRNVHRYVD